jgi:sec-independent protein translocase protein TatC
MLKEELKKRLYYIGVGYLLVIGIGIWKGEYILYGIKKLILLERGEEEIIRNMRVMETLEIGIKIIMEIGIILVIPLIWLELYSIVVGGLKKEEGKELWKIIVKGWLSILIGVWVSIGYIIPNIERWVNEINKGIGGELVKIENIGTIKENYEFIEKTILGVIVVGQIPIIVRIYKKKIERIGKKGIYMLICIISGILSPPELLSQLIISIPIIIWYERREWLEKRKKWKRKIECGEPHKKEKCHKWI